MCLWVSGRGAGAVIHKDVPMKKHSDAFYEYLAEFKALSDEEIVDLFNEQVGVQGWVSRRASYLAAIHYEFGRRRFDYSALASKEGKYPGLSYRYKVRLEGKKIIKLLPPPKKKTCCERAEAFYLGITCPHCHKPFRKNITSV